MRISSLARGPPRILHGPRHDLLRIDGGGDPLRPVQEMGHGPAARAAPAAGPLVAGYLLLKLPVMNHIPLLEIDPDRPQAQD